MIRWLTILLLIVGCDSTVDSENIHVCTNLTYIDQIETSLCNIDLLTAIELSSNDVDHLHNLLFEIINDSTKIRELGNLVIDDRIEYDSLKYKIFFSEYTGEYEQNNVYINYIYSQDGISWRISDRHIIDRSLEDPYVILYENIYYLFAEDKSDVPYKNIRRYHSSNAIEWIDDGDILDISPNNYYENRDVSSPIVVINNDQWYMYYEGRGEDWLGNINIARSDDGLYWIKMCDTPVYIPTIDETDWDSFGAVPDDIFMINDIYYMLYHGLDQENNWHMGILYSNDLYSWLRVNDTTFDNLNEVMYFPIDNTKSFIYIKDNQSIFSFEIEELNCET